MNPEGSRQKAAGNRSGLVLAGGAFCLLLSAFFALFPLGWLGEAWPGFGRWLGGVFATAWAHAVGHTLIFLLFGLAALFVFPVLRARPGVYFVLMCLAAVLQEAFQLLYKQRRLVFDDYRDWFTDLIGIALAFIIARRLLSHVKLAS